MSENEKMVPLSQAVRMLNTGFEWEAGLFFEVYGALKKQLGKEKAKEILGGAMYNAGLKLGKEARGIVESDDTFGMAKAWDSIYGAGTKEAEELDERAFIIKGQACAAYNLFKRWGMPEEEVRFISDAYCIGDVGQAEGFSDKLHFQHTGRLMRGDQFCRWAYSSKPQKPNTSAVSKDNFAKSDS